MEESSRSFPYIAVIAAIGFGWGALWAGSYGAKLAFNSHTETQPTRVQTAAIDSSASPASTVLRAIVASVAPPRPIRVLIGGDVMLDRGIRRIGQSKGYDSLFAGIAPLFKSEDAVIVNLEGPVTGNPSKTLLPDGTTSKEFTFTFDPDVVPSLKSAGITAVSLANNHTDNFGADGFDETESWLSNGGIRYFGSPWNATATEYVIASNSIPVAFVGYHAFQPGFGAIIDDVKRLSAQGNFVVVMPHWGVEYAPHPTDKMRSQARALIAAGASAVIGSHPHVIEDHEVIDGVPVFYSLGNLLFDQYFSPQVMKGDLVELTLSKKSDTIRLDSIRVYETSMSPKTGLSVDPNATDIPIQ